MKNIRQLTPNELLFIGGELPNVYQHSAGLIMLDSHGRSDFGFESFKQYLEERLEHVPHFHWKLHDVPWGLDMPYWVQDEEFSYDHHIRRIAVPSPGDRKALSELCSYLYCRHLDHNRPLWETWFIEGLPDGQFALFHKLHHALMDGQGAIKLGEIVCDFEPDAKPKSIDPQISEALPGEVPSQWQISVNLAKRYSRIPFQASREIYALVIPGIRKRFSRKEQEVTRPTLPIAHFNADISADRGFVFGSVPLAAIKSVKDHFEVTVNDVVLALVAGSLRNYLQRLNSLPKDSLRSAIGVSLRQDGDSDLGNKVTMANVTLATCMADPLERLRAIAEDSNKVKERARRGGKGFFELVQVLPPILVKLMMSMAPTDQVITLGGANLVVSNARGSSRPMYTAGVRQSASYPMAILARGIGLNITCVSYADNIDFGITIEPSMFPDPWDLIEGLNVTLQEYLALTRTHTGKTNSAESKSGRGKRMRSKATVARRKTVARKQRSTTRETA